MTTEVDIDVGTARTVAAAAGAALLAERARPGRDLGARGDRAAQDAAAAVLSRLAPGDAVLSEEAADDAARLTAARVWIVDPLDGTRQFAEPPRTDWAVHVALWTAASGLGAATVALPALDRVLDTDRAAAARPAPVRPDRPARLAVSASRAPAFADAVAADLRAEVVALGSVGYKVAAVVDGDVDAYLHAGGQYEWDSAAPVAVAVAAGLHASRIDGSRLHYNRPDPYLPDVLVCRPEYAAATLAAIHRHSPA